MSLARWLASVGGASLVLIGLATHASDRLDIVHLIAGAGAIVVARPTALALASLVLWLVGVLAAGAGLSLDAAANWLHFLVAVALLGLAPLVRREDLADNLERDLGGRLTAEV